MATEVTSGPSAPLNKQAPSSIAPARQGRESVGPSSREWRGKGETVEAKAGRSGEGLHSFSNEERKYLCGYLNHILKRDSYVSKHLPLDPSSNKIFEVVSDGIFLCKLLNTVASEALDERVLNFPGKKGALNAWEIQENHNLFLNAARACGCPLLNIGPSDLQNGTEYLVLSAIWQVVKLGLLEDISLDNVEELAVLTGPDEELDDLQVMAPDQVLIRWLNYHLSKSGVWGDRPKIASFDDLKDGMAYIVLFNQLNPSSYSLDAMELQSILERAGLVVTAAESIGVSKSAIPSASDLAGGNDKLALAFLASLFHAENGLRRYFDSRARESVVNFRKEDDPEVSREERTMRTWINSLGCTSHCKHLFDSLGDGYLLIEIAEKLSPGCVVWKGVHRPPVCSAFRRIENCTKALEVLEKHCGVHLVSVCGLDISERNKKSTLAVVWQIMRFHSLSLLATLGDNQDAGGATSEEAVLAWSNAQVEASGSQVRLSNFGDKTAGNCRFYLDLLRAVAPKKVDDDCIVCDDPDGPEACKLNAKYVISVCRKLGCAIFLSWDDIVECRPKMIFSLLAAIMAAVRQRDAIL